MKDLGFDFDEYKVYIYKFRQIYKCHVWFMIDLLKDVLISMEF